MHCGKLHTIYKCAISYLTLTRDKLSVSVTYINILILNSHIVTPSGELLTTVVSLITWQMKYVNITTPRF